MLLTVGSQLAMHMITGFFSDISEAVKYEAPYIR